MLISWFQFSTLGKVNSGSQKTRTKQKSNWCCNSDQIYEKIYLNFYMLTYLIQFSDGWKSEKWLKKDVTNKTSNLRYESDQIY